ncbi:hypothetical protein Bpfe_028802 [Biomphalaria pfeifferi]|uniref:Uncharacterized protein n=1 Tax=Biomphalaria pfeifferi TaxID=112525 RepID=A0AAD8AVI1_BIOPF|nr:hypothetical protein Bpfe_028802 [Biomphalaria pfeifferi]
MKSTKRKRKLIDQKQVSLKSKNSRHHETKYLKGKPDGQSVPSKFFGKHETQVSEHGEVENWFRLWQKLQEKFERSRFTFMVSHPHGCPKQVSFGQWVHNYVVDRSSDERDMSKLTYTTCTCPGSSGAGVFCVGFGEHVHSGSFDTKLNVSGIGFSNWN